MNLKPTLKQRLFAAAYARTGDGVFAARTAGYRGGEKRLAEVARDNLRKPHLQALIREERRRVAASPAKRPGDEKLLAGFEAAIGKLKTALASAQASPRAKQPSRRQSSSLPRRKSTLPRKGAAHRLAGKKKRATRKMIA